jgi:hypothetical protein
MNYIVTEKQLQILTENITSSKFSTEDKGLMKEQTLTLPYTVKGSHTVPANEQNKCDALHGFQLGRIGANMNGEVKKELDKFSGQGVWVSNVEVTVDIDNLKVDWVVTIDKSNDGQFWNGFTSRGAGCNGDIENRWKSEEVGNGPDSIVSKIKEEGICKGDVEIELVKKVDKIFQGNNSQFSFVQGFYRYKCVPKRTNTSNQMKKSFIGYTKENNDSPLKDYVGEYTFIDEDKKEVIGTVEVENNNLKVSKGERFFYLTRTQGDSFKGEVRVYHEDKPRLIPKLLKKGVMVKLECTFKRNPNGQVCSVEGVGKAVGIFEEKMFASKNGVSCDAQPEQKPVTPTTPQQPEQKPVTPTTPQQPEQKPVTPTTPQQPEQKPGGYRKPPKIMRLVTRV